MVRKPLWCGDKRPLTCCIERQCIVKADPYHVLDHETHSCPADSVANGRVKASEQPKDESGGNGRAWQLDRTRYLVPEPNGATMARI